MERKRIYVFFGMAAILQLFDSVYWVGRQYYVGLALIYSYAY